MTVREITREILGKAKHGWRYDRKRRLFVTWAVDATFQGKRYRRRGFPTRADAEKHLEDLIVVKRMDEIGLIRSQEYPTVRELFKKRIRDIDTRNERVTATRVMKKFLRVVGDNLMIDKVTRKHFKDYADERLTEDVKKETVNRELNPIARAFFGRRRLLRITELDPAEGVQVQGQPGRPNTGRHAGRVRAVHGTFSRAAASRGTGAILSRPPADRLAVQNVDHDGAQAR